LASATAAAAAATKLKHDRTGADHQVGRDGYGCLFSFLPISRIREVFEEERCCDGNDTQPS